MQAAEKDVSEVELVNEQIDNTAYNYKEDPNNPLVSCTKSQYQKKKFFNNIQQNWPKRKKYSNFIVVAMNAFIGYFSSAVYV
jgi:hypothetical protein